MATTISLATLRTRVKQRADMVSSSKLSDDEIDYYINNRYHYLCRTLARSTEYMTVESQEVTCTSGGGPYALPEHMSLVSVNGPSSEYCDTRITRIMPFNASSVTNYTSVGAANYWVQRDHTGTWYLNVVPNTYSGVLTVEYIPAPVTLENDSDEITTTIGEEELVIIDVAIIMRAREHSDVSQLQVERQEMLARLSEDIGFLDFSQHPRVELGPNTGVRMTR